jgi:Helicase associated domain
LGPWIAHQRQNQKEGNLSAERKSRLDEIGFEWDRLDSKWENMLEELLAFKDKHGHVKVPKSWSTGLCQWVQKQRQLNKKSNLSPERKAKLEELGFLWDIKKNDE